MTQSEIIIHAQDFENERTFIENEVQKNLDGKLDAYLRKYQKDDEKLRTEVTLVRRKKDDHADPEFEGKIVLTFPTTSFRSERTGFKKLDDLISHLFTHIKEQMSK